MSGGAYKPEERSGLIHGVVGSSEVLRVRNLVIDVGNVLTWVEGERVTLRLKEFELLVALVRRPGELRTRQELATEIRCAYYSRAAARSSRAIDVHVGHIRAALARHSSFDYVRTVRGLGYRFVERGLPLDGEVLDGRGAVGAPSRRSLPRRTAEG